MILGYKKIISVEMKMCISSIKWKLPVKKNIKCAIFLTFAPEKETFI